MKESRSKCCKTLPIHNLQKTDKHLHKMVSLLLTVTYTLAWRNTLAHYGIHRVGMRNVFMAQAPSSGTMTFIKTTPRIMIFSINGLFITLSINDTRITTPSIMTIIYDTSIIDTQQYNTKHNDIQHKGLIYNTA
jgi:hypothetical protein